MEAELRKSFPKTTSNGSSLKTGHNIKSEVIRDLNAFTALEHTWKELTEESDSYIYQTYEWNSTWWKYFGAGKELHIIAIYDEDMLISIIPFFWDTVTVKNHPVYSCLRLIGSTVSQPQGENLKGLRPYSDYLDIIIRPGYEKQAIEHAIQYFENQKLDYDSIILDEIPEQSCLWDILIPALTNRSISFSVENSSQCPIIEFDGSWEDYQNRQSKKTRYNNNRALRMVDENSKKGFHITEAENIDELQRSFELLVNLHQKRWNQLGFPGVFAEKRMYNFLHDITETFFDKGWVKLRMAEPVKDAGKVISVDLLFEYKNRIYLVHRALDQDSPFSKAGPGNVLLSVIMKEAADKGLKAVDFLRGTETFKFRTANTVAQNRKIIIENPLAKNSTVAKIYKKYLMLKRRTGIEGYQLLLFLKGKTLSKGIPGYFKFLQSRIKYKLSEKKNEGGKGKG